MSESAEKTDEVLNALTAEEQRILVQAIKQVERKLLEKTVKQIRNWVLVAAGVLTVFGVVSFVGIKATIVDQAAKRLSEDSQVKVPDRNGLPPCRSHGDQMNRLHRRQVPGAEPLSTNDPTL